MATLPKCLGLIQAANKQKIIRFDRVSFGERFLFLATSMSCCRRATFSAATAFKPPGRESLINVAIK